MALTPEQWAAQAAEVKRKASLNIPLSGTGNAANNALYAQTQANNASTNTTYASPTANTNTPAAQQSNPTAGIASPVKNAVTSSGAAPALGYGGATYGSSAAANQAISANQAALQNDPGRKEDEIKRTLNVIAARQAANMDTSDQQKYLTTNLGYVRPAQVQQAQMNQKRPTQPIARPTVYTPIQTMMSQVGGAPQSTINRSAQTGMSQIGALPRTTIDRNAQTGMSQIGNVPQAMIDRSAQTAMSGVAGVNQSLPEQQQATVAGQDFMNQQTALINQMQEQQQAAQMQALLKERDTRLQGLTGQETQARQGAYDARNQADAANIQAANRLRDAMGEQGLLASGENLSNLGALNAQRQSALGGITRDEANVMQGIAGQRALIGDQAAGDEAALIAALQGQRAQSMIDLGYRGQDIDFNNRQFDFNSDLARANLGLAQQGQAFGQAAQRDQFGLTRDEAAFNQALASQGQSFGQAQAQDQFGFNRDQAAFDQGMSRSAQEFGRAQAQDEFGFNRDQAAFNQALSAQAQKFNQAAEQDAFGQNREFSYADRLGYLDGLRTLAGSGQDMERDFGTADRLGTLGGQQTLQSQNQAFNQQLAQDQFNQAVKEGNLNAALNVAQQTGYNVAPQSDYSGLFRQSQQGGMGQTLQGQQVASGLVSEQQQRDLSTRDAAMREWQTTGYATPAVSAALGVPQGTLTSDQSYRQSGLMLDQDKFTYAQMTDAAGGKAPATVTGATGGDMLTQALTQTTLSEYPDQPATTSMITDPAKREEAFVNLINTTGLRGKDAITALTKGGYGFSEINALQKQYPEVFQ